MVETIDRTEALFRDWNDIVCSTEDAMLALLKGPEINQTKFSSSKVEYMKKTGREAVSLMRKAREAIKSLELQFELARQDARDHRITVEEC